MANSKKFKTGVEEAAKLLSGLGNRERVLELIAKQDPSMADKLKERMVSIEDLTRLTPKMLAEFMRSLKVSDLGLALRIGSPDLKNFIFKNVSSSNKREIQDILLGPPQSVDRVKEASERIVGALRQKVESGELVLSNPDDPTV